MKAKMSFDSAALKQFFMSHAEKLVFGVFVVVFALMCYAAFQVKRFDLLPEQLKNEVTLTQTKVSDAGRWNPEEHQIRIPKPPFVEQAKVAMKPVDAAKYALAIPFNPPNSDNRVRREEPLYLKPSDVRVAYGHGAVHLKEGYAGKQWVIVTALAPIGDQTVEYQKKFQNALHNDPSLDTPEYIDFEIERAEVNPLAPNAAPVWKKLDVAATEQEIVDKFSDFVEVVEKKYLDGVLSLPLPGLVGGAYDASAAHPDEIPFVAGAKADSAPAAAPAAGMKIGEAGGAPAAAGAPAVAGRRRRGGEAPPAAADKDGKPAEKTAETVRFKLVRFIDYTVENVKHYKYRVSLVLANPNRDVPSRFLKDPTLAAKGPTTTEPSDPSPVVSTPRDNRLLAGLVKPGTGTNESKATVLVVQWSPEYATEAKREFSVSRGEFLNFPNESSKVQVPGSATVRDGNVTYRTNALLLDMTGGESLTVPNLSKSLKAPAEILVMGPDGTLTIRSQAGDAGDYSKNMPVAGSPTTPSEEVSGQPGEMPQQPGAPATPPRRSIFDLPQ